MHGWASRPTVAHAMVDGILSDEPLMGTVLRGLSPLQRSTRGQSAKDSPRPPCDAGEPTQNDEENHVSESADNDRRLGWLCCFPDDMAQRFRAGGGGQEGRREDRLSLDGGASADRDARQSGRFPRRTLGRRHPLPYPKTEPGGAAPRARPEARLHQLPVSRLRDGPAQRRRNPRFLLPDSAAFQALGWHTEGRAGIRQDEEVE